MTVSSRCLIAFSSDYIVRFISLHPINWTMAHKANHHGSGDVLTPEPAVQCFLDCLHDKQDLFSWEDYVLYCQERWNQNFPVWYNEELTEDNRDGLAVRLRRNFYPSMIDSLHVWALINEQKWYDRCLIDSYQDAVSKSDLILIKGDMSISVGIRAPGSMCDQHFQWKNDFRCDGKERPHVMIQIPYDRTRNPGNKRWFMTSDLMHLQPEAYFKSVINA